MGDRGGDGRGDGGRQGGAQGGGVLCASDVALLLIAAQDDLCKVQAASTLSPVIILSSVLKLY